MSYEMISPQPPLRDPELAWDDRGPGLYDDGETALQLEDGTVVAVSVTPKWLENGAGVAFTAYARWIDEDGATHLDPHGQHTETVLSHTAPSLRVEELGVPAIARELLLAVLGEPPTTRPLEDGSNETAALVPFGAEVRLGASIRHAIACAAQTGPRFDAAAALGLAEEGD